MSIEVAAAYCRNREYWYRLERKSNFQFITVSKNSSPEWKALGNKLEELINSDADIHELYRFMGIEQETTPKGITVALPIMFEMELQESK